MIFLVETVLSGLMAGAMYALVAIGFVLIFKASGVFNFAQGVFCLFAALTLVSLLSGTIPFLHSKNPALAMPAWVAIPLTAAAMIGLACLIERFVLRYLVNQEGIILFMATIGLAFVIEGVGDTLWGSDVKVLDMGPAAGSVGLGAGQLHPVFREAGIGRGRVCRRVGRRAGVVLPIHQDRAGTSGRSPTIIRPRRPSVSR